MDAGVEESTSGRPKSCDTWARVYLVVPAGGGFLETRRFEVGPVPLTVGRAQASDVWIDMPGVDPEHARISEVALVALGSDVAVGDVPLEPGARRLLTAGDEIQVGSVVVVLEGEEASAEVTPRIRVVEGTSFGDELLLEEHREYTIGRGSHCDLVVEDREVSREHLRLVRRGDRVFVQDLSSTRGSWLGRSAVYSGATIEWARPRMLRVGATVLSLELPAELPPAINAPQPSAPTPPPPRFAHEAPVPTLASVDGPSFVFPAESSPDVAGPEAFGASALPQGDGAGGFGGVEPAASSRTAWKSSGSSFGTASGILLLVGVGALVLGVLYVVFSLLE